MTDRNHDGDTHDEWLTVADLARRLDRPDSTVRRWASLYGDLIDTRRSEQGSRTYSLQAMERIRDLADERLQAREIRRELAEAPAPTRADTVVWQAAVLAALNRIAELLERIAGPEG